MNVVRFDKFFEDDVNAYIRLELCHNNVWKALLWLMSALNSLFMQSMSELIKRRKRLTEPEARFYTLQLAAGIAYLHANLIIHRDLKLGNLFIDNNMTIKIGDFGLATKLTHESERKRTVCGTPNYIAPEILEGKDGHSFEVDIWSTGVIVYAMLVGRPPFECKDMKSTYKKILANSYDYPDNVSVSEGAKRLIGEVLQVRNINFKQLISKMRFFSQTRPQRRLSLAAIRDHSYFNKSNGYTPTWLPPTAMRHPPEACLTAGMPRTVDAAPNHRPQKMGPRDEQPVVTNDENDRHMVNRDRAAPSGAATDGAKAASNVFGDRKVIAEVNTNRSFKVRATAAAGPESNGSSSDQAPPAAPVARSTRSASAVHARPEGLESKMSQAQPLASRVNQQHSAISNLPTGRSSSGRLQQKAAPAVVDKINAQKFEVYSDLPEKKEPTVSAVGASDRQPQQKWAWQQPSVGGRGSSKDTDCPPALPAESKQAQCSSHWASSNRSDSATELKPAWRSAASSVRESTGSNTSTVNASRSKLQDRNRAEGSSSEVGLDTLGLGLAKMNLGRETDLDRKPEAQQAYADDLLIDNAAFEGDLVLNENDVGHGSRRESAGSSCGPSSDNAHSTPAVSGAVSNGRLGAQRPLRTLEAIHDTLSQSFVANPAPDADVGARINPCSLMGEFSNGGSDVWVVRYMDYTSKYGLGFLLNNGCAGVYFNDSTKIILSADGMVFQYFERCRRGCVSTASDGDHNKFTHLLSAHPAELTKKVTLLRHFRDYLLDKKTPDSPPVQEGKGNLVPLNPVKLPDPQPGVQAWTTAARGLDLNLWADMPYLKKWVRTRHAVLLRLSNRSVQVSFFDMR